MMFRHQETKLGVGAAWILAPLAFTLAFFYISTIWATSTDIDLQLIDVEKGARWGAVGLLVGVLIAVVVTVVYPPYINREFDHEGNSHHH